MPWIVGSPSSAIANVSNLREGERLEICVVSSGDLSADPERRLLIRSLAGVGHAVFTVDGGRGPVSWPGSATRVPSKVPARGGVLAAGVRRALPGSLQRSLYERRLAAAAGSPGVVYPASRRDLGVAIASQARAVARDPRWEPAHPKDLPTLAPADRRLGSDFPDLGHHWPEWTGSGETPSGRHAGRTIVMVHRASEATPARYLRSAMDRAGVSVIEVGTSLDWGTIPSDAEAVVVTESPLPAVRVAGRRRDIPVLYWVHHGEHHLAQNLRLAGRYGADAILLAHSWHLAHRFGVPVHRFPFGVPVELMSPETTPFDRRPLTVAMVGAGLDGSSERYARRASLARRLEGAFGDRAAMVQGVTPEELIGVYARSKVVINEGGDRHLPITMRVFEAIGAGAALLTDVLPGTEILFDEDTYSAPIDDVVEQVRSIAASDGTGAREATRRAWAQHTYDHRVDELVAIIDATTPTDPVPPLDSWSRILEPDVTTVAVIGADVGEPDLPDRAIVDVQRRPDAIIAEGVRGLDEALTSVRRMVYTTDRPTRDAVLARFPSASVSEMEGVHCIELVPGAGYRVDGDDD